MHDVFEPLETGDPRIAIRDMWALTDAYFRSGRRVCLVGAFALEETRDRFASTIRAYFTRWIEALAGALGRAGVSETIAAAAAEDAVLGIQGALVLARALGDDHLFPRSLERLAARLESSIPQR